MATLDSFNWWYYSLSAIAQVAGTILALGGAIVVFQLDKIRKAAINYRDRLIQCVLVPYWRDKRNTNLGRKTEMDFYEVSDDIVMSDLKNIMKKVQFEIASNEDANRYKIAIQQRHPPHLGSETLSWIMATQKSLNTNVLAEKIILIDFKQSIIALAFVILASLFQLSFFTPDEWKNVLAFSWLMPLYLIFIIFSVYKFWKMLRQRYISY